MNEIKGMLQSKTIWGALLAVAATVSSMAGWDIGNTDGMAEDMAALVGAVIAIYGRAVAVKRIAA